MDTIQMQPHIPKTADPAAFAPFTPEAAASTLAYHRSFPGYRPTPLRRLNGLAARLGLGELYVKDESYRFGLNAFKALGGTHALGRILAKRAGLLPERADYAALRSPAAHSAGTCTFVTATDGNHGRGVAWAAKELGHNARVFLPQGSAPARLEAIRALGAQAEIAPLDYDSTVRLAARYAQDTGGILVQDTAWEGYREIPLWIMQGYLTMALETARQLADERPTHIFLQAGVGSMAAAVAAFFQALYSHGQTPVVAVVEPHGANCFYRTARAGDGMLHPAPAPLRSIMAGLCCGEPNPLAWEVLDGTASFFFSCPDRVTIRGMRLLTGREAGDAPIVSGESGAVTVGLTAELMGDPALRSLRDDLGLDARSRVLCFSTEGDTDPAGYRRIVGPSHPSEGRM